METIGSGDRHPGEALPPRAAYHARLANLTAAFPADGNGRAACRARSAALDQLVRSLWTAQVPPPGLPLALMAIGGYGRGRLFPFSDVDLLFCTGRGAPAELTRDLIRRLTETLWDCGLKVSPATRTLSDCERFTAADPEFGLALLDLRFVAGHKETGTALLAKILERRSPREARALAAAAAELTRARHARYGDTLFHLEPNVKDAPGGLRDAHICDWLARLRGATPAEGASPFTEAVSFLTSTRVFLHLLHGRDDNTLDWHTQDEAAAQAIGLSHKDAATRPSPDPAAPDPAAWMRTYFRQARAVERGLLRELEASDLLPRPSRAIRRVKAPPLSGFFLRDGVLELKTPIPPGGTSPATTLDPAHEAEIVLAAFGQIATSGVTLGFGSEERIAASIPWLSGTLEEGPRLWSRLRTLLMGRHAGSALRELHALGVLELILPEFHGIDALVIRDAYHRYTVDEHTFVLIDVLHSLAEDPPAAAPEWRNRFRSTLLELHHPDLLFLAALLHDTGKGRAATDHALASGRLAVSVCTRLELGSYETGLVVRLIECHLEMSAALRRDIFDLETVRPFADRVGTQELLRMLTLFTYADISAVHPDALTPWKAENLWRLAMATANQLDRSVDAERVRPREARTAETVASLVQALGRSGTDRAALQHFLEGFPERYLRTRSAEAIQAHLALLQGAFEHPVLLNHKDGVGEVAIVSLDRPSLFADLASILADWGMDVVTAEAFSNAHGVVVDTFRFADTYRTLEMNPGEAQRLAKDLAGAVIRNAPAAGRPPAQLSQPTEDNQPTKLTAQTPAQTPTQPPAQLVARRRGRRPVPRRRVETAISFDNNASSHSTLLQVVAQNIPGLLRTAALVLSQSGCSVEVALIDSEGDMAIDVFYLTRDGGKLAPHDLHALQTSLLEAIEINAR